MDPNISWSELSTLIEESVSKAVKASVTEIMLKLQSEVNKLSEHVSSLDARFTILSSDLKLSTSNQAIQIATLEKKLLMMESQSAIDSSLIEQKREAISRLENEMRLTKEEGRKNLQLINDLDQRAKLLNLRITGLKVQPQTSKQEILSFIRDKLNIVNVTDTDILKVSIIQKKFSSNDGVSYVGPTNPSQATNASLIITFANELIKDTVLLKRRQLKGSHIGISEDLTILNSQFMAKSRSDTRINTIWAWKGKLYFTIHGDSKKRIINPTVSIDEQIAGITQLKK